MPNAKQIYLLLFSLYLAQGLPVGFMTHALPTILRVEGLSLAQIGGFGLLMLPWSIKVFWAPLVDRFGSQKIGHYRSWIIPMQCMSIIALIFLSFIPVASLNQPTYLLLFFIVLLWMNLVGATQDVGTDGLAVKLLKNEQLGWGNTLQVIGSRLGFIIGGGAILVALDWLSWQPTFLLLAALVLINTFPILNFKEPHHQISKTLNKQPNFFKNIREYLTYFTHTPELVAWVVVLMTFKLADGLSGPLLKPLMVDLQLSYSQIGIFVTMFGAIAALFGAVFAGLYLKKISREYALIFFSFLKVCSMLAYTWLAYQYDQKQFVEPIVIYLINAFEDMVSAMLLVVMLTLVMTYCRKAYAGTDFTFQVAIMATVSGLLYTISGVIADQIGYSTYMMMISVIAGLSIVPIVIWMKLKKS